MKTIISAIITMFVSLFAAKTEEPNVEFVLTLAHIRPAGVKASAAVKDGGIGKYNWIKTQINGIECWKTAEQMANIGYDVTMRSARA
jgi:hypothetical protein